MHESVAASLEHMERLSEKINTLAAAQLETEGQLAHRIGDLWTAGELTAPDLLALYYRFRSASGPGWSNRWKAAGLPMEAPLRRLSANIPNGPAGSWYGTMVKGKPGDPCPPKGTAVVYVLFSEAMTPLYVGSTGAFRARAWAHAREKDFTHWAAYPCVDREHAYAMEAALIREHKLSLNKAEPGIRSPCRYSSTGWCVPSCDVRQGCLAHAGLLEEYADRVTSE